MRRVLAVLLSLLMLSAAASGEAEFWSFDENAQTAGGDTQGLTRYIVNCEEYVTLRSAPDTGAPALARIPLGAEVICYGEADASFSEVEYGGDYGYVLTRYLGWGGESSEAEDESWFADEAGFEDGSQAGDLYEIEDENPAEGAPEFEGESRAEDACADGDEYWSGDAYADGDEVPCETGSEAMFVAHCREYITLRAYPSTDAPAVARVPLGVKVMVYAFVEDGFCQANYDGLDGYVLAEYLSANPPSMPAPGAYLGSDPGCERLSAASVEVYASSELVDQYGYYCAANANDSDATTTWAEAAEDIGAGEWLSFFFEEREVAGFAIRAGYQKSADHYRTNARPRQIRVCVAGEEDMLVTLEDVRGEQIVLFDRPVLTDYVSLEIVSAYTGTRFSDTCISDVRILLAPGR